MLEKIVGEECCREVLEKSVGEDCCREVLRSGVKECFERVLWRRVL